MKCMRMPDGYPPHKLAPYEYTLAKGGYWMFRSPQNLLANLSRHDVHENESGEITVSPSILVSTAYGDRTISDHGFIENGIWRGA